MTTPIDSSPPLYLRVAAWRYVARQQSINPEVGCRTNRETVEERVMKVHRKIAELGYIEELVQEM